MKRIILAVGATGLGKTTMAHLFCGVNVKGSSGTDSSTKEAKIYETDEFFYMDTCGFDDSFGTTDDKIFHDMMRLFQRHGKNNIFNIDTILWFCCESEREMNHLRREANFIQRFTEYTDECEPVDIWKSVLIITKGTFPSRELADGPKSAAKNACKDFSNNVQFNEDSFFVEHFPCWIYDIRSPTNYDLIPANYYRKDEIKSKIQRLISNFSPISVHFKQGKCQKCNAIGDPRLFNARCHDTSIFNHSVKIDYFHPKQIVNYHIGDKSLDHDEPDEISILKILENLFSSNPEPPPSRVSSEIGKKIVELSKEETLERSSNSCVSRLFSRVAFRASQLAITVLSPFAAPRLLPSSAITSVYLLSATGTSLAVLAVSIGGIVYYYETKNIPCKRCKRSMGSKGCIEICYNCKKEWEKDGCDTGYECCKEKEEKPGCRAREKCIICQETAIELKTKGCTQYCAKCKETCNTPGCDPSFKHDVIMD